MITVFYDGKCGLCSKEISHYRKVAPDGIFDWQDITKSASGLEQNGVSLSTGLKFLHVKDESGKLYVGVNAFILIWKQLEIWRFLAYFISLPVLNNLANAIYLAFINWRFNRLEHCQLAENKERNNF